MEGSEAGGLLNSPQSTGQCPPQRMTWLICHWGNPCRCPLVLWHEEPKMTVVPTSVSLSQCPLVEAPVIQWNLIQFQLHLKGHNSLGGDQMVRSTAQDSAPISAAGLARCGSWETRPRIVHCPLLSSFTLPSLGVVSVSCWDPGWHYTNRFHRFPMHRAQHTPSNSKKSPGLGLRTLGPRVSVQRVCFPKLLHHLHSHEQRQKVTVVPCSCQHFVLSVFKFL